MQLITRLKRLVRADAHALIDKLEHPQLLLRQALRDMEKALRQHQDLITQQMVMIKALDRRLSEESRHISHLDKEIKSCLSMHENVIAKNFIRRKLQTTHQRELTESKLKTLNAQLRNERLQFNENTQKYREFKKRADLMLHGKEALDSLEYSVRPVAEVFKEDVEIEFLRASQKSQLSTQGHEHASL